MQNCANCTLNMQHSHKHTCINVELRISNQQTNIRSERHFLWHRCHAQVLLAAESRDMVCQKGPGNTVGRYVG